MEHVIVRAAGPSDIEALCGLYVEFHEFHVLGVPDRLLTLGEPAEFDCSELIATLGKILDSDDAALFVADTEGRLIGFAEMYIRVDHSADVRVARRYGYLQSLLVSHSYRSLGVGKQLLEVAERWGRDKGASEVRLETWEFPAGPLTFYEQRGYRTLRRVLVREL